MSVTPRFVRARRNPTLFCAVVLLACISLRVVAAVEVPSVLAIDPANSRVAIDVGRTGLFGFAGHNHEVIAPVIEGKVIYNPADWQRSTVSLRFDASALKVTGKGDPPSDIPKVQQAMLSAEVLDVKRFPDVTFASRRVSATRAATGAIDLLIEGDMTVHGQTRPMSVRVNAAIDPDGLTVRGGFPLKQTDFGIEPVTVAGGTVRVKDEVQVQFVLKARRVS